MKMCLRLYILPENRFPETFCPGKMPKNYEFVISCPQIKIPYSSLMKMLPVLLLLLCVHNGFANENAEKLKTVYLNFQPTYNGERLITDSPGRFICQDKPVIFETFKCYISHVIFLNNGKTVFKDNHTAYLLDAATPGSLRPSFELPDSINYDEVGFCLGIDSAINNSGILGGCLNPLKGM